MSIIDALKARYSEPGSAVMKVLSTLALPQQVVASMVREAVERDKDPYMPDLPMGQAALRGIADPTTSYADVPGVGTKTGIAMDIALDPLWVVPGKAMTSVVSAPVKLAGRGVSKTVRSVPVLDTVATRLMTKISKNYEKTRAGYKGFENVELEARMGLNEVQHALFDDTAREIEKLQPDVARRKRAFEIAELRPPDELRGAIPLDEADLVMSQRALRGAVERHAKQEKSALEELASIRTQKAAMINSIKGVTEDVRAASIAEFNRVERAVDSIRIKQAKILSDHIDAVKDRQKIVQKYHARMVKAENERSKAEKLVGGRLVRSKVHDDLVESIQREWFKSMEEFSRREARERLAFSRLEEERKVLAAQRIKRLSQLRNPRGSKRNKDYKALKKGLAKAEPTETLARRFDLERSLQAGPASKAFRALDEKALRVGGGDPSVIYAAQEEWAREFEKLIAKEDRVIARATRAKDGIQQAGIEAIVAQSMYADAVKAENMMKNARWMEHLAKIDSEYAALPSSDRAVVDIIRDRMGTIKKFRIGMGGLDEKVAQEFEERTGLSYMQRTLARRDDIVNDMDRAMKEFAPHWTPEVAQEFKHIRDTISQMGQQPSESYLRMLMRTHSEGRTIIPGYLKYRKIAKSVRALRESPEMYDQVLYAVLEKDIARNLRQASTSTARAVYRNLYLKSFREWMQSRNLLVHADDLPKLHPGLRGRGPTEMVEIKNVPELKGFYGPRVLVADLEDMVLSPLDPQRVKDSLSIMRKANAWWRGWALSAPMTVIRNAGDSLVWRNVASGARPKDMPHWFVASSILRDAANGTLDDVAKINGKTAKAWYQEFVRAGTVRSNVFAETREMARGMNPQSAAARLLDPQANPASKFLFDQYEKVEDLARSGMYMWRLSKGDTPVQAMKFVNKWHIDYVYGLTQWEKGVRDRFVPFYTFTRFNVPLALETLYAHPKLLAAAGHTQEATEDILGGPEPDFPLAGWMQSGTPLRIGYDSGTDTYMIYMLDGVWSFTDINKVIPGRTLDELANMISPLIKTPYEVIKNVKLFPEAAHPRTLERPGDKFEMFGKKADIPFGKRVETMLRIFRPINEADRWIEAWSDKYGDTKGERAANVFMRATLGKVYPANREEQALYFKAGTNEQLRELRAAKNRLERDGESTEEVEEKIKGIMDARKELGIK
jgi:hypothetical protein